MTKQIITLSDNAAERIKQIMSHADKTTIGVRVGVKSGGCAGMSYVMEYAKEVKPNEEVIEDNSENDTADEVEWCSHNQTQRHIPRKRTLPT